MKIPDEILYYQHVDLFRVVENRESHWDIISEDVDIDAALFVAEKMKEMYPDFQYVIIPIFKMSKS